MKPKLLLGLALVLSGGLANILFLAMCFGCAAPPKYYGQFSGTVESVILQDIAGEKFTAVKFRINSANFSKAAPNQNVVGLTQILVDSSWNCYCPADFKTNTMILSGWMKTGAIKNPFSHKDVNTSKDAGINLFGALVVRRHDIP